MNNKIKEAANLIKHSKHTTGFTGAGISVESGIPPFRGQEGLWSKYDPQVLDLSYLFNNPLPAWQVIRELFYDFFGKAEPNAAHRFLAKLEQNNMLNSVITQNIDNLHQEAGSTKVFEFHGTAQTIACTKCNYKVASEKVDMKQLPPQCPRCNNLLKPDFIFFGEGIPEKAYSGSAQEADKAEVFIVIGTTGEVMPACMIPQMAKRNGCKIIEINTEKSSYTDSITDIFLQGKAGDISVLLEKELGLS